MMQHDVQMMQDKYAFLMDNREILEKSVEIWRQNITAAQELNAFYQTQEWIDLHERWDIELETRGHYSVLSEDAIWNALEDLHELIENMKEILSHKI